MVFGLRDKRRYGLFKANSDIGEVKISISIYGFGEKIKVYKDKKEVGYADTSDGEEINETDNYIDVEDIRVSKPFIRCLKRY